MVSYRSLYYAMVCSLDDALTYLDKQDIRRARDTMQKALLDAETVLMEHDVIPDESDDKKGLL